GGPRPGTKPSDAGNGGLTGSAEAPKAGPSGAGGAKAGTGGPGAGEPGAEPGHDDRGGSSRSPDAGRGPQGRSPYGSGSSRTPRESGRSSQEQGRRPYAPPADDLDDDGSDTRPQPRVTADGTPVPQRPADTPAEKGSQQPASRDSSRDASSEGTSSGEKTVRTRSLSEPASPP